MKREAIITTACAIVIALQSWILCEIVTMRERLKSVETTIAIYHGGQRL
jgi:hypothetical protein